MIHYKRTLHVLASLYSDVESMCEKQRGLALLNIVDNSILRDEIKVDKRKRSHNGTSYCEHSIKA